MHGQGNDLRPYSSFIVTFGVVSPFLAHLLCMQLLLRHWLRARLRVLVLHGYSKFGFLFEKGLLCDTLVNAKGSDLCK